MAIHGFQQHRLVLFLILASVTLNFFLLTERNNASMETSKLKFFLLTNFCVFGPKFCQRKKKIMIDEAKGGGWIQRIISTVSCSWCCYNELVIEITGNLLIANMHFKRFFMYCTFYSLISQVFNMKQDKIASSIHFMLITTVPAA
jgi:hypothetical protein